MKTRTPATDQPFHIGDCVEYTIIDTIIARGTVRAVSHVTNTFIAYRQVTPEGHLAVNTAQVATTLLTVEYDIEDDFGNTTVAEFSPGVTEERRGYPIKIEAEQPRTPGTWTCIECGLPMTAAQAYSNECPHCGGF